MTISRNGKVTHLGSKLNLIQELHKSTKRDYIGRMLDEKVQCMSVARKFDFDYWDGQRRYGFGGYKYIPGRWKGMAQNLIDRYGLTNSSSILDVGCGKGFLLYEIQLLLPEIKIVGVDISKYAIENCHESLKAHFFVQDCRKKLEFPDKYFDLVISINTLHNFELPSVVEALTEIQRLGINSYVVVEAYETLTQFFNLQCWALTAPTLITPKEWEWLFDTAGFNGDFEYIFFD